MKHILLATVGSLGDLHPMLALGGELLRRGHRVTLAAMEAYRERVEAEGLAFHPMAPHFCPNDPPLLRRIMQYRSGPEFLIRELLLPSLREQLTDLESALRGADMLVVGEIVYAASIAAQRLGKPWAAAILAPFSFMSVEDPAIIPQIPFTPYLRRAPRPIRRMVKAIGPLVVRRWGEPIHALRRELGLPAVRQPLLEDRFSPHLNLAMFSQALAAPAADWPPHTVQTGFDFHDAPPPGQDALQEEALERFAAFARRGPPPLVFTLGSAAVQVADDFYAESVAAARLLGRPAALLAGGNDVDRLVSPSVAAFEYLPHAAVFPQAAAAVHQGGVGTTAQALRAGVPQLVVPHGFDQPDNAARVGRLGVARTLARGRYRAARVAAAIEPLLSDPVYRRKAEAVERQIAAEGGVVIAADAVLGMVSP